jgi:hypothetical protein
MKRFKIDFYKYIWFIGGFAVGYTLISLGHAAIPDRAQTVTEIRGSKVNSPELAESFAALNQMESKYAENWNQQQRLRSAVARTRSQYAAKKKSRQ